MFVKAAVTLFAVVSASVGLTLVAQIPKISQETKLPKQHYAITLTSCAQACSECQRLCDMCTTHCMKMMEEGKKEHSVTLASCQDCASVCSTASRIVAREGPFSELICTACAEACQICAKDCEKFAEDAHMKKCAEECRKCEKACKEMIEHKK